MKNLLASVLIFFMTFYGLHAQLTYGFRGGINSSNVKLDIARIGNYSFDYARSGLGFHAGGILQWKISDFFVQPEVLFTSARADVRLTIHDFVAPDTVNGEQRFNRIDIPLIAGYKLGPVKLQTGPVLIMSLGSNSKLLDDYNIRQEFSPVTVGYQFGLGVELTSLLLDLKYEGNFGYSGNGININGSPYEMQQWTNQIILSLGFLFGNSY